MSEVSIIGLDIAKHVFQAHGVVASGHVILRKKIMRSKLLKPIDPIRRPLFARSLPRSLSRWNCHNRNG